MKVHNNDGFTLVELLVTIVVASIVAAAAGTVLLMGIRLNANSTNTAQRQNTTRVFLSVMEDLASEGTIDKVVDQPDHWYVAENDGENVKILFYYDSETGTIYSGGTLSGTTYSAGTPMMEEVIASHITENDSLITVAIETEDGSYSSSVYCRNGSVLESSKVDGEAIINQSIGEMAGTEIVGKQARAAFLSKLMSQLGSNGMIYKEIGDDRMIKTPVFYSQWYNSSWATDTPWCACYISWVLDSLSRGGQIQNLDRVHQSGDKYLWYANVDDFIKFFEDENKHNANNDPAETDTKHRWVSLKGVDLSKPENADKVPNPGDIIFMDWTRQQKDAAHVGVVLAVRDVDDNGVDDYIYTIEGNTANMVAVRKYPVGDPVLMGYGVIDWKSDT